MNCKKIFIVLVLLITIFSLSTVSAEDDISNMNINETSIDEYQLSTNDNIVLTNENVDVTSNSDVGSFTELNQLIQAGGTIELDKDYKYSASDGSGFQNNGISITKNTIINGNGHVIDCLNENDYNSRLFVVQGFGVTLTLNDVTITNAKAGATFYGGSVVYCTGANTINVNNVTVANSSGCSARNTLFYLDGGTRINVDNSVFEDNQVESIFSLQSAVFNIKNSEFLRNSITENRAGISGIFIDAMAQGTVESSIFINNTGTNSIAYVDMDLTFRNNILINNGEKLITNGWGYVVSSNNYWGTNDNSVISSFLEGVSNSNNVYLSIIGPNSFSEATSQDYSIVFSGNLPSIDLSLSLDPNIANYPSTVEVTTYSAVSLTPTNFGNTTLIVGSEYGGLTSKDIEIIKSNLKSYNLSVSANNASYGEDVTINVSLYDEDNVAVTGVVEVEIGDNKYDVDVVDGVGSIIVNNMVPNKYTVVATYTSLNSQYRNASASAVFKITKASSTIDLTVNPTELKDGENVLLTVQSNLANVVVNFYAGETLIGFNTTNDEGIATYIYNPSYGEYNISAKIADSDFYSGANSSVISITVAPKIVSHLTLDSNETGSISGDSVSFDVILTDENNNPIANANVLVYVNGVNTRILITDDEGKASFIETFQDNNVFNVKVEYEGSSEYYADSSNVISIFLIKGNTFTDLALIIASSIEGSIIDLNKDYFYNPVVDFGNNYINGIKIDKNITINGNGYTVSGSNLASLFDIENANVVFNNINLKDAFVSYDNSAISISNGELTIINSTIDNIVAGNILDGQAGDTFAVSDVVSIANYLENYYLANNGLPNHIVYNNKTYSLASISDVLAKALINYNEGNFDDIALRIVASPENPSGYADSNLVVPKDVYISNNQGIDSGGMASRFVTWIDNNNQAPNFMGARTFVTFDLYYTSFIESAARALSYYGVHNQLPETTYYIGYIPIIQVMTGTQGTAILARSSQVSLTDTDISNIKGTLNSQGAVYLDESHSTIKGSSFENITTSEGSGLYIRLGDVDIDSSIFSNIKSTGTGWGGVINSQIANIKINNSKFNNNAALGDYAWGGVGSFNGGNIIVDNSEFNDNFVNITNLNPDIAAQFNVGGVFYLQSSANLTVSNSKFNNNFASASDIDATFSSPSRSGGVIYLMSGTKADIVNSTFDGNSAVVYSGVIYAATNTQLNIYDSNFTNTKNARYGGVITVNTSPGNVLIKNSNFIDNEAEENIINIFAGDIDSCNFVNNTANEIVSVIGDVNIANSSFIDNLARDGIVSTYLHLFIEQSSFINNSVTGGAVIYSAEGGIIVNYNIFVNNEVASDNIVLISDYASSLSNLNSNYWGTNDSPVVLKLISGSNYVLDSYITLTISGNSSTYETLPTEFIVKFEGSGSDKLPDFITTICINPEIAILTPNIIEVTDEGVVVELFPEEVGNSTLIVGFEYNNLTTFDLEVLELIRNNYTFTISANNATYGENVEIEFRLFDAEGVGLNTVLSYTINGETFDIAIVDGIGSISLPLLDVDEYHINSSYITDDFFYNNASAITEFTVDKAEGELTIEVDDIVYGDIAYIVGNVPIYATGNITFVIEGITTQVREVISGSASFLISQLQPGDYTIKAYYSGDSNYLSSESEYTFNVDKQDAQLAIEVDDINYGDNITGNVTLVSGNTSISGNVVITINNKNYTVSVVNGKGTIQIEDVLPVSDNYEVTVTYGGSDIYKNTSAVTSFAVGKASSDMEIIISLEYVAGDDVEVNINIGDNAEGTVTVILDNNEEFTVDVVNGVATVILPEVLGGSHNIQVNYSGDLNYNSSQKNTSFDVKFFAADIDLDITNAIYGDSAYIVAEVSDDATGYVIFKVNGVEYRVELDGNKASLIVTGLNAGTYTVDASYSGDGKYAGSSTSDSLTIEKAPFNIEISVGTIIEGENVYIYADVPSNATGNILFSIPGLYSERNKTIENGRATWLISPLETGAYEIIASYAGDNNYLPSTATYYLSVNQLNSTLEVTVDDVIYGEDVVISANLFDENGKGLTAYVNITIDNKKYRIAVFNGTGTLTIGKLDADNYEFDAIFGGFKDVKLSTDSGSFAVNKANPSFEINTPDVITSEEELLVTISSDDEITGTFVVTIANKEYEVDFINGKANVTIPALGEEGVYELSVTYSGDNNYNSLTKNTTVTVKDQNVFLFADDVDMVYHDGSRYVVEVVDGSGSPLVGVSVVISINGVDYVRVSDGEGLASLALNLGSGVYNISASVNGTSIVNRVVISPTVVGSDVVKYFRNGTQYQAFVTDSEGNILADTVVRFNINGVFYDRVTNAQGIATLSINLNPGKYIITALNTVSGEMTSNEITVLPTLVDSSDIVKYFRNGTQYSVKVLDSHGNPLAGETVTFNINGVFYERVSDADGVATLAINLNPGDYIITAQYNGLSASNDITVLPTVEGSDIVKYFRNGTQYSVKLVDTQGKPVADKNVTFNINGVFYARTTNDEGNATLNINLNPGEYIITAQDPNNGLMMSNKITVLPIIETEDITMTTSSRTPFEAKILDDTGNALANQEVTFNINGVFYDRVSDENGIARLNINLNPGSYVITTLYNNYAVSNTITIN